MSIRTKIAIGLGSNLGDREKNIRKAFERLQEEFLFEAKLSTLIETPPWGIEDQPSFLNAAAIGLSEWKPTAIVNYCKLLERELGRVDAVKYGPRLIDLDLLLFGEETWKSEGVVVPHPEMHKRSFVLMPLVELDPNWIHPIEKKTISELLVKLK